MDLFKRIMSLALVFAMVMLVAPLQILTVNAADTTATISFADAANRTEFSPTKQVWQQNGITVTNEQGSSTAKVADYVNPVRFYKSTTLEVAYEGMTGILVNCATAEYATALADSISGVAGAEAVKSSNAVTVTFTSAVNSLKIESLAGQVRVDSIAVYTGDETPEAPEAEDPAAAEKLTIADAVVMGTAMESNTYTTEKYRVTGVITEVYNTQYGNMYIADDEGNILTIYGSYDATGETSYAKMDVQPVAGDTVTIYGAVGQHNGKAQIKNGWIIEHTPASTTPEEPEQPETPEVPETPAVGVVDAPVAGEAYKFGMVQGNVENKLFYITGAMDGYYMATTEDATAAADVYLEETTDGYYLYTMVEGAKKYINMVVSGTHVNGAFEDAAATVYTYDTESKTVIATVEDAPYWFGTRNDKTFTTVGPCKTEYEGFYCQFYASEGGETPEEPEQPEEPETTEIVDIATALAGADSETFSVKGVVTVVDGSNYYVQDATGAICVRLATNTTEIALGDTIIGTGARATYNGMPQLGSATFEKSSGLTLEAKETTIDALTAADICTYVTIKGLTVTEVYDKDGQYTSPNVTAQDANGNSIQIYKAVVAKENDAWAIQVGDVIDVTAGVGCYNATLQLRNTLETEIVLADTTPDEEAVYADFNGDGVVTDADAIYLLRHTLFPEDYEISGDGDINGDGSITDADAVYLLRYTLFPEDYPLTKKDQ